MNLSTWKRPPPRLATAATTPRRARESARPLTMLHVRITMTCSMLPCRLPCQMIVSGKYSCCMHVNTS